MRCSCFFLFNTSAFCSILTRVFDSVTLSRHVGRHAGHYTTRRSIPPADHKIDIHLVRDAIHRHEHVCDRRQIHTQASPAQTPREAKQSNASLSPSVKRCHPRDASYTRYMPGTAHHQAQQVKPCNTGTNRYICSNTP